MSKSELEMEDPEKLPDDSDNIVQESQSKVVGDNVESKGEESLCEAAASEDVNEKENGGENLNECRKDEKNDTKDITEAEGQTYHKNEGNEEVIVHEKISAKNGIEDLINTKDNADEDPPGPISAVEKQTDAENVVVDQKAANGGMKKEYLTDDGNHMEYVKENTSEDVAIENPEIIVQSNPDDGEHMVLGGKTTEDADVESRQLPTNEDPKNEKVDLDVVRQSEDVEIKTTDNLDKDEPVKDDPIEQGAEIKTTDNLDKDEPVKDDPTEQGAETVLHHETDGNNQEVVVASKRDGEDTIIANQHEATTPVLVKCSTLKAGDHSGDTFKTASTLATLPPIGEGDDGTLEDQIAFMKELDSFHQEKALEFKPPKFYGQPLNCLKLWRAVIRLGGYDTVTGAKLWRQVGESFHPPKTCTTVSWTFRIFYEKSLLEYERHKTRSGELHLPVPTPPEASSIDGAGEGSSYQGSGSGRARRDSASRAMQGWHVQRLSGQGEIGDPIMKDKNLGNMAKREKNLKSISSLKQKRPNEVEHSNKVARTEIFKQLATSVVDVGPPADWVKINVRQTKECFEIYALVPGLLREEVRVQSDPAGRVVITGQPEQGDNPWGITPFKKVISLPTRIDPLETSAVVSLHGRLFVRVPFEQSK